MSLDKTTVRKIATLARIEVPEDQLDGLGTELSAIIDWVEQLGALDTDGVEPMTSAVETTLFRRTDAVTDGNCRDRILANAPETAEGFFVVPKVIE
ncbi:MAG: Asp-tRNA(Asn)/Glu-tRNA(Gln) amidotransferase subunit GatC [Acetobacterales bacterium]